MSGNGKDRTQAERAERLRLAMDSAQIGTWDYDLLTGEILWDERSRNLFGLPGEGPVFYPQVIACIHPDDRQAVDRAIKDALDPACSGDYQMEFRVIWPDGSVHWIRGKGKVFFAGEGEDRRAVHIVGTNMDFTARRETEEALRESEERLRIAKGAARLGIHDYDIASGVIHWDERVRELWGIGLDVPVTYDLFMAGLHPDDRVPTQAAVERALDPRGKGEYAAEYRVVSLADGVERWVAATGHTFFEGGRPVRLVGTVQDITGRKRAESELLEAKEAAEAGNRAKDRFLVNMSHELRTPLTVIMGMLELALPEVETPEPRRYLESARHSSEALLALIGDILEMARVEKGEILLREEPFDLHEWLREEVGAFFSQAARKGIALRLEIDPAMPRQVLGDRGRLTQILDKMVGNALRFTDRGEIEVRVHPEGENREDGRREVRFDVRDTGIGIPEEAMGRLFRKFTQIDDSLVRRFGGSGLGLAISQGLVKTMGGRVTAESTPGEGSLFSFVIPFRLAEEAAAAEPAPLPSSAPRPLSILVGEDDPMIGSLLRLILERRGWKVDLAEDGRSVLERWEGDGYDLILMDVQMPGMDGLESTRIIREREAGRVRTRVPILALTAHARQEDEELCLSAGMDGFLSKPIGMERLYEAVMGAMKTTGSKKGARPH